MRRVERREERGGEERRREERRGGKERTEEEGGEGKEEERRKEGERGEEERRGGKTLLQLLSVNLPSFLPSESHGSSSSPLSRLQLDPLVQKLKAGPT